MSVLTVQAWHCDLCGHTWLSETEPKRCSKCKSSKWNQFVTASPTMAMMEHVPVTHAEKIIAKLPEKVRENVRSGVVFERPAHDPKTCRLYGCFLCKEAKAEMDSKLDVKAAN